MCGGPNEIPDDLRRDRVEKLLERAFADDPELQEAFLPIRRSEQAKKVGNATPEGDAEAPRQVKDAPTGDPP